MKTFSGKVFFLVSLFIVIGSDMLKAQATYINDCDGYAFSFPQWVPWASTGSGGNNQNTGSTGVPGTLAWSYQNSPLINPAATAHSGSYVLRVNTNTAAAGNSRVLYSGAFDFSRNCTDAQFTFSFWMYRFGTDANADRIRILANTAQTLTGATLLTTIHRSRALSPTVYGLDGWYKYEVVIPSGFVNGTYLMLDAIDGGAGANGHIYIDDLQFFDNSWSPFNVTGPVANAGNDVSICNGGNTQIGSPSAPGVTYSWLPTTGLSSSTVANPVASPTITTDYTVTAVGSNTGCTLPKTDIVRVTVLGAQAPVITSASSTTVCSGTALAFPFSASNSPTGYLWLAADNPSTSGESNSITVNAATLNDVITSASPQVVTYSVSAYSASCPAGATNPVQTFSVTVNSPASATNPVNATICAGGTAMFNTTASGGGSFVYQWQVNGANVAGATASTFSRTEPTAGTYSVRCVVSNGCAPSYTTGNAILTVLAPPTLNITGTSIPCNGGTGNLTATGTGIATYSWSNGSTASSIVVFAGVYTCTVTSAAGCQTSSSYALSQPSILGSFTSGPTVLCSGGTANIMISGTGGTPGYNFSWVAASNPNITGESTVPQSGSTINNTLTNTSATTQSVNYSYNVTDANGCVISGTKTITVYSSSITISVPTDVTICQTSSTTFSAPASGGSGFFTYQWEEDNGGGFAPISDIGVYSGTGTAYLTISIPPPSMNGYRYRCQINDGCNSLLSAVARLFVTPALYYSSGAAEHPVLLSVGRCASKQEILRFKIDMTTGSCPSTPTVTNIGFTAAGTETEINRAYIYYTGTNPNFSTNNLYATITNVVGGTINAAGSQVVNSGTVYFWLAYDINPSGVAGSVDANWSTITFTGGAYPGTYTISTGNPAGARNISTCVAPGGISSGLTYWLKSDDSNNLSGNVHDAPVRSWGSSYSDTALLRQPTSTKRPIFKEYPHDTLFNFNPYVSFDGNDDILQNAFAVDLLNDDGLAMIICARNSSPNNLPCFGFSASDGGLQYQISPEDELRYQNSTGTQVVSFNVSGFTDPDTDFIQAKMVAIHGNSTGSPDFADFMRNDDVFQSSGNNAPYVEQGVNLGGSGDGGSFDRGNNTIAEIITYNKNLSKAELDQVQTYAAIKYGIHLNKDYISSAGDVIWDYTADPTYNNDIAGIGRDDKSGLNQKQTQSVNIDEMLTIGLDSIENSNKNNTAVFAVDNSFLVWGNNNLPAYSTLATSIPVAAPLLPTGIQARINRVWKLQGTNFGTSGNNFKSLNDTSLNKVAATTIISVGFDDYLLQGVTSTSNLRLLIDDDGTDFSNAIVKGPGKSTTGSTASSSRIIFDTIEVGDGKNYITLGTINKVSTPLPIQLIDFYADCDNNKIVLHWKTASEINTKEFIIEYSTDGVNFNSYKIVSAKGGENINTSYKIPVDLTLKGAIYFRLKEITTANDYYYYKTIGIEGDCNKYGNTSEAIISPNPVSSLVGEASIKFSNMINGETKIRLINNVGSVIYETTYKSEEDYNTLKLSFKGLTSGVYFIDANNNKGSFKLKLIVTD